METVYVDVLLVLNIYVNYFLLRITAALTGSALKVRRCIAASAYGSLFSLLSVAPELSFTAVTAIKSLAAITIVMLAFGIHGKIRLFKDTVAFFVSNFILAGTVYAIYSWARPDFIHIGNYYFYADFSLIILIVSTATLYFITALAKRFLAAEQHINGNYNVSIRHKDKIIMLEGLADTGNKLFDHFSGRPVIVCDSELFYPDLEKAAASLPRGFRLVPCGTVSGSSVMPIFRPDEVIISNNDSGERKPVNVMIGIGQSGGKAIFDPLILKR
ncbi:MAG: sigma-E processing peptidase SpoIIGA [Ruminococcus sp.]|nr:sigma-E processing peptidase SpoIIGA [Ruminococcus sp.]